MKIPEGKTQEEVQDIILTLSKKLAPNFKFGYLTAEDMIQQACLIGCKSLQKALENGSYDKERPLENFLFTSIRNGLVNFKRDNYKRTDTPCKLCYQRNQGDTHHEDRRYCEKYKVWDARNIKKQNILMPFDISGISDEEEKNTRTESSVYQDVERNELIEIIDRNLPVEDRAAYLRMREGVSVPKNRREEIINKIRGIINESTSAT
jgi:DNA-directed RNA polymerase specialized sigma subunit